ncbi:MAG: Ig-like domain-containing protein [Hyalangium sp.]|uniref:Ig-like domain-containing protein n=1 Tax=Hyalangium sp. TaxID=2028555 RepID=UPI00389AE960
MSCGSEEEPPPVSVDEMAPSRIEITGGIKAGTTFSGQTTLEAVAEDDSGQVAKVTFLVSNKLACVDKTPRDSGSTFSCTWSTGNAPEGSYQLVAVAEDAAGNTSISQPVPFFIGVNVPPTISTLSATSTNINEGQSTSLSVTASDQTGDVLTYSWTQESPAAPVGAFTNGDTATPTWKAPLLSATTTFTLRVTVSDGKGGTTQRTVDVQVANVASANRAPTVDAAITASATSVLAGDTATLSIGATDPDGDPLTYTWKTTNPTTNGGTFSSTSGASTGWRSPDIAAATNYTLQVTVSDGVASVSRSVTVKANVPTYAADIQSIWTQKCTTCHSGASPSGGMDLSQGQSYASLVNITGNNKCGATTALRRVRPGLPDSSLLVKKIEGSCGTRMPQNDTQYFADNPGLITRIRSWILANALNN